jgi:hypothetical protein
MSETPGIMGQMPPLPAFVHEDKLNSLLQVDRMVRTHDLAIVGEVHHMHNTCQCAVILSICALEVVATMSQLHKNVVFILKVQSYGEAHAAHMKQEPRS